MKITRIDDLKELYNKGVNIMSYLKEAYGSNENTEEAIKIAYDFQAGTYVEYFNRNREHYEQLTDLTVSTINQHFPLAKSILDVGAGELTNTSLLYSKLKRIDSFFAFDISLSRLLVGRSFVQQSKIFSHGINLFIATMSSIPLPDNSIDIIISNHAIEPNRGNEKQIISELLRISRYGLILQEPDYKSASDEQRARMDRLGYVDSIEESADALGEIIAIKQIPYWTCENNKASSFTIRKKQKNRENIQRKPGYVDPITKDPLIFSGGFYYSSSRGVLFPVVSNIPVFDDASSIICTKYMEFSKS